MSATAMISLHQPWIEAEEEAAVLRVLRSGRLANNGAECAAFERELQARLGVSLPGTDLVAASVVRLPIYRRLTEAHIDVVVGPLREALDA